MIKIPADKRKHFYVGLFLGGIIYLLTYYLFRFKTTTIIAVTLGIVATISYVFELFSKVTGEGHYEVLDAIAGIAGGSVAIALLVWILP
jgi:lipopolysaccharide export LptBFGC system permease protein LptF